MLGCNNISRTYNRRSNVVSITCCSVIGLTVERHYAFGHSLKDGATVDSSTSSSILVHTNNHRVLRILKGEETSKGYEIGRCSAVGSPHLCCTRFSCYRNKLRCSFLTHSECHNFAQTGLYVTHCLFFSHVFSLYDRLKSLYRFAVVKNGFDKTRSHHLTIIGNTIIESQRGDGWNLRYITYTHPREVSLCPIFSFLSRSNDARFGIAWNRQMQVIAHTRIHNTIDKLLRLIAIELINKITHTNIGGVLDTLTRHHTAISARAPVVVFHLTSIHINNASPHINGVIEMEVAIIERHEERHRLKHRAWLHEVTNGFVLYLHK